MISSVNLGNRWLGYGVGVAAVLALSISIGKILSAWQRASCFSPMPAVSSPTDLSFQNPRREPPLSMVDTVVIRRGVVESAHGGGSLVSSNVLFEQVKALPPLDENCATDSHGITQDGRHVLQQQARRSCYPTAIAMILLDRKLVSSKKVATLSQAMRGTNLMDDSGADHLIQQLGVRGKRIERERTESVLPWLQQMLSQYGSGVLTISHSTMGGHAIVVDRIDKGFVTVRDPWHGQSFRVPAQEFASWKPDQFLVIR